MKLRQRPATEQPLEARVYSDGQAHPTPPAPGMVPSHVSHTTDANGVTRTSIKVVQPIEREGNHDAASLQILAPHLAAELQHFWMIQAKTDAIDSRASEG